LDIKSTQIGRIKQWPLFSTLVLGFISTLLPQLTIMTNLFIVLTFILQAITTSSYIKENNKNINKLVKENNTNQIEIEYTKEEKEKTKTLEKNIDFSSKKKLEELKKFKNELIENNNDKIEEKGFQKRKK
jgi:hypothetical protein